MGLSATCHFHLVVAVIASAVVAFPLMYQSAKTGFADIDPDIQGAAMVDGASDWQVFIHISVPLAYPSLLTGSILSLARALGEFGATLMFAGNIPGVTQTLPTAIYVALDSGNNALAWAWVVCIVFISFLMLFFIQQKRHTKNSHAVTGVFIKTEARRDLGRHAHLCLMRQFCPCLLETIRNQKYQRFR